MASFYKWSVRFLAAFLLLIPGHLTDALPLHPLFVSVTEVEYNATARTLEISCKVFTDDLEKALKKTNGSGVDVYNPKDKALLEKQLSGYITQKLKLAVEGKPVQLRYVGYEIEEQSTFSYYEVKDIVKAPGKVDISNAIFYELYDKQMGIIHLTVNGTRKSARIEFPDTDTHFNFPIP